MSSFLSISRSLSHNHGAASRNGLLLVSPAVGNPFPLLLALRYANAARESDGVICEFPRVTPDHSTPVNYGRLVYGAASQHTMDERDEEEE